MFSGTIKLFSFEHLIIIFVAILFVALGITYVKKIINNKKRIHRFLVIISVLLLIFWIGCRISHVYHSIDEKVVENFFGEDRYYNWFVLIPNSFCSLIGLVVPFIIFFNKYKNNKFLESTYCMAIIGLLSNTIYPEYIVRMPFYQLRTCGSIIYHVLCGFIMIVLLMTKDLKLKLKNWYYTPISISFMITLGVFELLYLDFPESFNISIPLVPWFSFTTVGFLCIGYILIDIIFRFILDKRGRI